MQRVSLNFMQISATFLLLLLFLAGCAILPPITDLSDEQQLQEIGSVSADSPLAWHPDGSRYAVSANGLVVRHLDGDSDKIDYANPAAISWSPTGAFLASAFSRHSDATVKIFDTLNWSLLAEIQVTGQIHDLVWRTDAELLFAAVNLKQFSFGGNYSVRLYRWRQNEELIFTTIADTSPLKSTLDSLKDTIFNTVHLQLSPYRDEIAFTRFFDPPAVDPYYQLVVRNLTSGRERIVAKMPIGSQGGRYLRGSDALFYSDGRYQSIVGSIWGTASYETFVPGLFLEISRGGRFKLIDQQLLRGRTNYLEFERITTAAFSPDGSKLLFVSGKILYLLSNLDDLSVKPVTVSPRLLELRRWRSEGLITPQEFEKYFQQLDLN